MASMRDNDRAELLGAAAATAGTLPAAQQISAAQVTTLLRGFYRDVLGEDLLAEAPRDLLGAALSHLATARSRRPGTANVRVLAPGVEEAGWAAEATLVEIVTDDMPFLVDSVIAELSRQHHTVRLLVHPQPRVQRDGAGTLTAVVDPGDDAPDALTESWVQVHVDPVTDPAARADLTAGLHRVLTDVRAAVTDWAPMEAQAREISAGLGATPPAHVPPAEVDEARALLDWLADGQFVFLGYREYAFTPGTETDEAYLEPLPATGLGLLHDDDRERRTLPPAPARKAAEPRLVIVTKANSRSTVHRPDYLDYVAVKVIDDAGRVTGEQRFIGLFTPTAYDWSVTDVPFVSSKVRQVQDRVGYDPVSHLGKDLLRVLEDYPRDELFQAPVSQLAEVATAVVHLRHRPRTRLFLRADNYERFMAFLVYLAHDRYTPAVREKIEDVLREAVGAQGVEHATLVSESTLAQLYFVVRVAPGTALPDIDGAELERRVAAAARTWEEDLADAAVEQLGATDAHRLLARFGEGFPEGYKEDVGPAEAAQDLRHLDELTDDALGLRLYLPPGAEPEGRRLKLYRRRPLALSAVLPIFQGLGVEVIDQRPHTVREADGTPTYVSDVGLDLRSGRLWPASSEDFAARLQDAFLAVWHGSAEGDGFNALVLLAGLTWQQVVVLRAAAAYLRQAGSVYSREYVEATLRDNPRLARLVVELFETRFDPDRPGADDERERAEEDVAARLVADLDDVASLDQDRILRAIVGIVRATLRTSYFQHLRPTATGHDGPPTVTFKLDPHQVPELPAPRPAFELWVYGPRVEGVHLRFGEIARGGLRWSDRREDFRTEVLGLVKAQVVKNAIIVPTGAKGGFVAKDLPDPAADRDAWLAAGRAAYRLLIDAMLDVTDNIVDGEVAAPRRVVRHDGDDPYLVVAADKGTAAFSDVANEISQEHGFWLDDAFASGGSTGYDHKKMGITARGAWISVQRHFRERGHDTQREDFTAVGIGDMSGDVFGNGMLRSEHIRLVAAFDHRHVFLDPDPDAAASFVERQRLFDLPRSSWADYDTSLLSAGGGVHPRSAKSVPISPEVRHRLGLDEDVEHLAPAELIRAILTAPVDLLWNGGIGTYVKASGESHAQIGDRANNAIRVDGAELRCHVVGEGGNLGVSQLGRVEAALHGVHINTDAIDNSGGVDSSDQEVNIKILLATATANGRLAPEDRGELLASMTDEVAERVLRQNYEQNVLLGNARTQQAFMLGAHQRFMHWLEERGELDRALEFLPPDSELAQRAERGQGLTSPEFAVLVAYAKLALKADLIASDLPDDPWFERELREYFPPALQEGFAAEIPTHRLRREIITTQVTNSVINRGGITFVHRALDETGADSSQIARAFVISREVFGLAGFVRDVERLDNEVDTEVQSEIYLEFRRLLDRAVRWFVEHGTAGLDVGGEIDRFARPVGQLVAGVTGFLRGRARQDVLDRVGELTQAGVPRPLAETAATLVESFSLLDAVALGERAGRPAERVAPLRFAAEEHFGIDRLLLRVRELPREQRWDSLARVALREDLHAVLNLLTERVMAEGEETSSVDELLAAWDASHPEGTERLHDVLAELEEREEVSFASLSVALRTLRALVG